MILRAAWAIAAAAAWLAGCAGVAPPTPPAAPASSKPGIALLNAGFEATPVAGNRCAESWSCTMHNDPDAFRFTHEEGRAAEGRRAFCIERERPEPWALLTQGVQAPALRGKRLRFSAAVRVDRAEGEGTGPWALVHGPHGNLAHAQRLAKVPQGWQRLAIEFPVGATAHLIEVGATMEGGGRACLDDARLEILD